MRRELSAMEEWIYRFSRRQYNPLPINFGIAVECEKPLSVETVRRALDTIPSYHPLSCAHVVLQAPLRGIITTENTSPITLTLKKIPHIWNAISEELRILFNDPMSPLVRVTLYESPQGYFLYAHFDHALADGISAITWIHTLFALIFNDPPSPSTNVDWKNLFKKHQQANWEHLYSFSRPNLLKSIQKWFAFIHEPVWPEHLSYTILTHALSREQTSLLQKATRKHNSSVHAALAISFLQAFHENQIFHTRSKRTVLTPVNLRKKYHLTEETYGLLNGTLQTTVDFSKPLDFWKRCALFKKELTLQWHNTNFLSSYYRAEKDLTNAFLYGFSRRRRFDTRQNYDLSLSNIGVISSRHLKGRVKNIYGPLAQGLPTETVLGVITYENVLTLSWVSKPFFLPDETSQRLFNRGIEILLSHLE